MMIESFIRYIRYEKNYSSHTVNSYKNDLMQFEKYCRDLIGDFDPLQVDLDIVRSWMVSMSEVGVEVSSVKRKISALRSFYKYLKREGKIKESPLCLLSMPKSRKKLPVFIRVDQMDKLIDSVDFGDDFEGVRNRLMLVVLYTTGVRRSELVALKVGDVDFFQSVLKVTGKGNKQRLIPFGDEMSEMMRVYLGLREGFVEDGVDAFFIRKTGEAIYPGLLYKVVRDSVSMVSTSTKRSPHVLRHSFATAMLNGGSDLSVVKELLGHSTLSSTEVYTHVALKEVMKSYNQAHPRAAKEKGGKL